MKRDPSANSGVGLDFSIMEAEAKQPKSASRQHKTIEAKMLENRNSSYLYTVLQPELKQNHAKKFKVYASRNIKSNNFIVGHGGGTY